MERFITWLHLLSLAAYLGTTLAIVVVLLPAVERVERHEDRLRILVDLLRRLNPLLIAVMGVLIMTGAFGLTGYKARLGADFFARVGDVLAVKLALVFVLVGGVTYTVFGVGHRIVRAFEWGDPLPPEKLASMLRRLRLGSILNLALAAWICWVALALTAGATP